MNSTDLVFESDFPELHFLRRGKVRDIYEVGEHLLIVATDRLSAYDVIMNQPIPFKGKVLTQISNYWFDLMKGIIPNHVIETDVDKFPEECRQYRTQLEGRSILVRRAEPLPIECVARGYLSGSGWNEYLDSGSVCGVKLPKGLVESSKLPEPIFTPATKAEVGHDENIDFSRAASLVGREIAERVREFTIAIYRKACSIAEKKGIIIADTKMEFGMLEGRLILIDELLTPDSSRFWPEAEYQPGGPQKSFDKQFVRDYLVSIGFNKKPPAPHLPDEVIQKTSALYLDAMKRLTDTTVNDA